MDLRAGEVVADRYELVRLLGEGGMGIVWEAMHRVSRKHVALKFLKATSDDLKRRFVREARVAATVDHENIVPIHDVLELEDGGAVLVMDLLEGESLADHLTRRGKLDVPHAAEVLLPVFAALGVAHARGIVHRDLKPENVFLARRDDGKHVVKLLDFGIAKTLNESAIEHSTKLTRTGSVMGTPTYMAPEQVFGESDIDHRADIWSLGVIAYEILDGACPIVGDNVGQIFKAISTRGFTPMAKAHPELPLEVTATIDSMLSLSPSGRPFSLAPVAGVFARAAGVEPPSIPAPLQGSRVGTAAHVDPRDATAETMLGRDPRARQIRAAAAAFALALVVVVAWVVFSDHAARAGDLAPGVHAATVRFAPPEPAPSRADEELPPAARTASPEPPRVAPIARRTNVPATSASAPPAPAERRGPGGIHVESPYGK